MGVETKYRIFSFNRNLSDSLERYLLHRSKMLKCEKEVEYSEDLIIFDIFNDDGILETFLKNLKLYDKLPEFWIIIPDFMKDDLNGILKFMINKLSKGECRDYWESHCITYENLLNSLDNIKKEKYLCFNNIFKNIYEILQIREDIGLGSMVEILRRVNKVDSDLCTSTRDREYFRSQVFHSSKRGNDKQIIQQMIADLIVDNMDYLKVNNELQVKDSQNLNCNKIIDKNESNSETVKILWIENNPDDVKEKIINSINLYQNYELFLFDGKGYRFSNFYKDLKNNKSKKQIDHYGIKRINGRDCELKSIEEVDVFLIDLFLCENKDEPNGEDFIEIFKEKFPQTPIIILSISTDYSEVVTCLQKGADFYLQKKYPEYLPYYISLIHKKYGKIIQQYITHRSYKKNLLGNIRYWMFHQDFLWYGDKCYHMINHSFLHIKDNWKITNELFDLLDKVDEFSDNNIYSFSMAIWLHDIGHKGNERYGEAYQIRDTHGLISGELILKNPSLFNIIEIDESKEKKEEYDEYYESLSFPLGPLKKPVTQVIMERSDPKGLTNLEKIALFSIYHKSNSPLTQYDAMKRISKNKYIPSEYFMNSDSEKGDIISLQKILESRYDNPEQIEAILKLTSLFRFIDGLDIHKTRVGDFSEKELKVDVINHDYQYYKKKLNEVVQSIISRIASNDTALALGIYDQLYKQALEKIESHKFTIDNTYQEFLIKELGNIDEYLMVLNYASFISVQEGHFYLHSCVDDIEISACDNITDDSIILEIRYYINQDLKWMCNNNVREMRVGAMSILEKFLGNKSQNILPYPIDELKEGTEKLRFILNLDKGINLTLYLNYDKDEENDIDKMLRKHQLVRETVNVNLMKITRKFKFDNNHLCFI